MRAKTTSALLAIGLGLLLAVGAQGRQAGLSDEARIKQLRDGIRAMVENAPEAGAPDEERHRGTLTKLRADLHRLLLKRTGAYESRIANLEKSSLPEIQEYVRQLKSDLQAVNEEIAGLERDFGGQHPTVVAALSAPLPSPPAVSPQTEADAAAPQPTPEAAARSFAAAVREISAAELREAAAPPAVAASELPAPACTEAGRPAPGAAASRLDEAICRMANDVSLARRTKAILISRDQANLYSILIAKLLKTRGDASYAAFVAEAQEARTDQQVGAGPNAAGTTSLVSKGGIPFLLGFAVENGAAVRSNDDTTVTFRLNPGGLISTFANRGFITGFQEGGRHPLVRFLQKTSVGLTFDTSRGGESGVFTGDRQQLSEFSARVEFVNERDPRHKRYERMWESFVAEEGVALAQRIWATTLATVQLDQNAPAQFRDPFLQAWLDETNREIERLDPGLSVAERTNAVARIIREQADLLPVDKVSDETVSAVNGFAAQFIEYSQKKQELLDEIAKGRVFTFEYTNKREVSAPDTSNLRFIAATGPGGRIDLTANGSLTLFHDRPTPLTPTDAAPGRVRDFQFAGQVDVPFKLGEVGQFVFWFGGRYERLLEDAMTETGAVVPGTKGNIAVGQFGLKFPIRSLGVQLPVSFTFANRTELVKEREVRGNFGFTFNLDSILARFKPF